ncbi:MAG: hypothetical protein ACXWJH_06715 [Hyphomicrobium sp.]
MARNNEILEPADEFRLIEKAHGPPGDRMIERRHRQRQREAERRELTQHVAPAQGIEFGSSAICMKR